MQPIPALASVARLIADPSRAAMLDQLMDGSSRSIGELARAARVSLSTASEHVGLLERGGLVSTDRVGRRRLVRLRDASVAWTLESLANTAGATPDSATGTGMARLRAARTCYDHLAGRLGVGIVDALVERGALAPEEDAFRLAAPGRIWFSSIGVDTEDLVNQRRTVARACLDWTERRPHLAGSLGAALARRTVELGWVVRLSGSRALLVTPEGRAFLEGAFGAAPGWARPGSRAAWSSEPMAGHATILAPRGFRLTDAPSSRAVPRAEGSTTP